MIAVISTISNSLSIILRYAKPFALWPIPNTTLIPSNGALNEATHAQTVTIFLGLIKIPLHMSSPFRLKATNEL